LCRYQCRGGDGRGDGKTGMMKRPAATRRGCGRRWFAAGRASR
jgi:hypothetical protein